MTTLGLWRGGVYATPGRGSPVLECRHLYRSGRGGLIRKAQAGLKTSETKLFQCENLMLQLFLIGADSY